tara:strand:- start:1569 stop:2438 length:870 start_codon:yes stop_codon:yes gene_type:complete
MHNNFSAEKIQKDLYNLTGCKYTINYINQTFKKIFENIIKSKKRKFLISGSQGCGKTTLLKLIDENFKKFYNINPLCLSLDDYYLTKKQRKELSTRVHPLFLTRGVPGTHDTKKIIKTINEFNNNKMPIKIPIFDKLNDERKNKYKYIKFKKDILVLEGWCCGCKPIEKKYLLKNINQIEKIDQQFKWRKYYNKELKTNYKKIFNKFDTFIYYKIPNFKCVFNWRLKQEKNLNKTKNKLNKYMKENEIKKFIMYYEKITKWMIKTSPEKSDLLIKINKNNEIKKIYSKF